MNYNIVELVTVVVVFFMFVSNLKLEAQVKGLKASLDQVTKQMGLQKHPATDEIKALIVSGKDVKAVKKARELYGFSLVEGKEYIDALKSEAE